MSEYKINSFGMGMFKGVNHGETPDKNSILLDRLKSGFDILLNWVTPITIAVKYVKPDGDIAKLTFEDVVAIKWWPNGEFCEIEYKSGNDCITIEILKADVIAIDEIVKPSLLTGKSRRVQ